MTKINEQTVDSIAHLARLAIHEQDKAHYAQDMSKIITLVEQLQPIDTSGIDPLINPSKDTQRFRPDHITEGNQREQLQANAPQVDNGLFMVPSVLD